MSSILKALKKLEEETARRDGGATDIARDILRISPRKRQASWLLPSLILSGALVIAALLLFFRPSSETLPQTERPVTPRPSLPQEKDDISAHPAAVKVLPVEKTLSEKNPEPYVSAPAKAPVTTPPPSAPEAVSEALPSAHPDLIVTGIAYQDDRPSRMAIVNDLPVMEGTHVDRALVEEILADRVIFSIEGKRVEIPLTITE